MITGFGEGTINFSHPKGVYYAGQDLTGHVNFTLVEPLSFLALKVHFYGAANVRWEDTRIWHYESIKKEIPMKFIGQETYFDESIIALGGTGKVHNLHVGTHCIPFSFFIPHNCPSSFQHEIGNVTYTVTVSVENATQEKIKKEFFVVAPFNLNKGSPRIKEPVEMEFEELTSCCYDFKLLKVSIRLPVSGYCPGMCIPLYIKVLNEGPFEIRHMFFKLYSKYRFLSQQVDDDGIWKESTSELISPHTTLSKITVGAILNSKDIREFKRELPVPNMIAPYLENCSIISVGYFVKARIVVGGFIGDFEAEREICLGLVPLTEITDVPYVHPMQEDLPNGSIPSPREALPLTSVAVSGTSSYRTPEGYPQSRTRIPRENPTAPPETFEEFYNSSVSPCDLINNPPYAPYPNKNFSDFIEIRSELISSPPYSTEHTSNNRTSSFEHHTNISHNLPYPSEDVPLKELPSSCNKSQEDPPPSYESVVDKPHARSNDAIARCHEPSSTFHGHNTSSHETSAPSHVHSSISHEQSAASNGNTGVSHAYESCITSVGHGAISHESSAHSYDLSSISHGHGATSHESSAQSYDHSSTSHEPSASCDASYDAPSDSCNASYDN